MVGADNRYRYYRREQILQARRILFFRDNLGESYAALFGWVNQQGLKLAGPVREVYLVGPESGKAPQEYVTEHQAPIG